MNGWCQGKSPTPLLETCTLLVRTFTGLEEDRNQLGENETDLDDQQIKMSVMTSLFAHVLDSLVVAMECFEGGVYFAQCLQLCCIYSRMASL